MSSKMGLVLLERFKPQCIGKCITAADLGHTDEGAENEVCYPHKDCPVHDTITPRELAYRH